MKGENNVSEYIYLKNIKKIIIMFRNLTLFYSGFELLMKNLS